MIEALRAALVRHPRVVHPDWPGRTNPIEAGVLVPVGLLDGRPTAFAVARSPKLRRHPGEIGFPGGRREAGDLDLRATALREAQEEGSFVEVDVLGRLSSMPVYTSDHRLEPFVGWVSGGPFRPDGSEIEAIVPLDLLDWLARPEIEGVVYTAHGRTALSPIFDVGCARPMFGATAHTFHELLGVVADALSSEVPPVRPGRWSVDDLFAPPRADERRPGPAVGPRV